MRKEKEISMNEVKVSEVKWVCSTCGQENLDELAENEKPGLVISRNGTLLFEGCKKCYTWLQDSITEDGQ